MLMKQEKQAELRQLLTDSISGLYGIEPIARLAEFWQGEQRVLLYIHQHDGREINPSTLSDELRVSRARITTALTSLRQKEYITMEMCENDRRRMRVILTAHGKQHIELKQREVAIQLDELIRGLGESNTLEFIRLANQSIGIMNDTPARFSQA